MTPKLRLGDVRIGHTRSGVEARDEVVVAEFTARGVELSWPRNISFEDAFALNERTEIPDPLILRDGDGWLTLTGGDSLGSSASSLHHSVERFRYRRAVHAGARGRDYRELNGMLSEVDGLARWVRRSPVETHLLRGSNGDIDGVLLEARNQDPVELGGRLGLQFTTSYSHQPHPSSGIYTIPTSMNVRTVSDELVDWREHQRVHRMVQDFVCLVFGRACGAELKSVSRQDDSELRPDDPRIFWREAFEPDFGRAVVDANGEAADREPLFYLDETNQEELARWISNYDRWSRPTWIAMSVLFARGLPIESALLQVAVALEALGHAIASTDPGATSASRSFVDCLKCIFMALGHTPQAVVGESSMEDWCREFNAAYKGVKHADNPLTEPSVAVEKTVEALTLFRCWLAAMVGVPSDLVVSRLKTQPEVSWL